MRGQRWVGRSNQCVTIPHMCVFVRGGAVQPGQYVVKSVKGISVGLRQSGGWVFYCVGRVDGQK